MSLPDVQNTRGEYQFPVMAGVNQLHIPIKVARKNDGLIDTIAVADLRTYLSKQLKGINMSRLPIIMNQRLRDNWVVDNLQILLRDINSIMESSYSTVKLQFPFFFDKAAPVTENVGTSYCDVTFAAEMLSRTLADSDMEAYAFQLTVKAYVTTLCPCSRDISDYSAHNQRASVEMTVRYQELVYIEELVAIAERCSSCARFPVLKRPDEKYVTERAYENPKFVEDLAREVAVQLSLDPRIIGFHVTAISEESIHQHDAIAVVEEGMDTLRLRI